MTSFPDVPSGATWRCVDLHLHTPGVHSFSLPGGTDEHNETHREHVAALADDGRAERYGDLDDA